MIVRIGPEKGVIHIATAAVGNAIWDMYARSRSKPLWKLVVDMTPVRALSPPPQLHGQLVDLISQEELVRSTTFRYITDVITPEEALKWLKEKEAGKMEREANVRKLG